MMDHPKGSLMKRMQMQSANNDHTIDEMDLTNGLMSVNMPMDLQQSISIMSHGGNSGKDTLPMDLQQHHRMEIDDEPVNLMAVNIDQDQLVHHQNSHSSHLTQSHQSHQQQQQQLEQNKGIQHPQNNSYALQIQSQHSPDLQQPVPELDLTISNGNNNNSDPVDERRIIRVKKNKDPLIMNSLNDDYQLSMDEQDHVNIIMDKPVQPKSIASLPSPFRLSRVSGNEIAVFNDTTKSIPANCRLGPVEGPLRKAFGEISNINAAYPTLVVADNDNSMWQLDRTDDEFCNWMKFVRLAHSIKDQNALVVESEVSLGFIKLA